MRRRQAAGRLGRLGWPDTWLGPCLGWPAALAITPKLNIIPDHHSMPRAGPEFISIDCADINDSSKDNNYGFNF